MTLWLMYAKKPTKICGKNLAKICDKNPLKICDKNLYITKTFLIFNNSNKQKTFMSTKIPMTWTLINQAKNPKTLQTIYTYTDSVGRLFKFEPHPTKSFSYLSEASQSVTDKERAKILDGYIQNGIKQHDFVGGFQEAILKITI